MEGKKFIESEMDRFEKEISSLAPTMSISRSFIPAQLRKPMSSSSSAPAKPSPIIISGAPQVYNPSSKTSETTTAPQMKPTFQKEHSNASTPGTSAAASQPVTIVKPLDPLKSKIKSPDKKKKKKKKKDDKDKKPKKLLRSAGGQIWEDLSLQDWDPKDFRLFCGDLGNDVTDEVLTRVFARYPSFQRARVIRDRRSNKTKGFGFVSFKDPNDFVKAIRELDGRYVGSRPIKLRKSNWKSRNIDEARKRDKERGQLLSLIKK